MIIPGKGGREERILGDRLGSNQLQFNKDAKKGYWNGAARRSIDTPGQVDSLAVSDASITQMEDMIFYERLFIDEMTGISL